MSSHNELLKEIEEHLEKLASAHTVLSDAIENEKQAGLVQAITKGVGAVTNFARTPVQHTTAGIGEIVHGARHSTTAQKGAVAGVGLLGAAAGGGSGQNKQAAEDSEHTGYKPHYLRNMAIGAGVAAVPGLLRAKSLNGVIAKSKSSIEDLVKERRAVLDHTDSGLYAESTKFNANMAKVDSLKTLIKGEQGTVDSLNIKRRDTLKAAGGAGVIGSYVAAAGTAAHSDHKNRDELYQPRYGRNVAIAAGLTSALPGATLVELGLAAGGTALATKLNSMRHAYWEKQASEDDNTYSPHYVRNAVLTGGALAAPDAARAYKSVAQGLVHQDLAAKFRDNSAHYDLKGDTGAAINSSTQAREQARLAREAELHAHSLRGSIGKKLATGAALATAVTGVNHIMHRGTEKQASDDDHSVRNSLLVGIAAGGSQVPSWFKDKKDEAVSGINLDMANEINDHNLVDRENAAATFRHYHETGNMDKAIEAHKAYQEAGSKVFDSQSEVNSHRLLRDLAKEKKLNALKRAGVLGLGTAALSYGVQNAVSRHGQTKSASLKAILQALETC